MAIIPTPGGDPQPPKPEHPPVPIGEPEPDRLPDEEPVPNPDENDEPPMHADRAASRALADLPGERNKSRWPFGVWRGLGSLLLVSALALSAPAVAQESQTPAAPPAAPEASSGTDVCDADPEDDDPTLSEQLERCRGVLDPPEVGDDIVEEPPATGRTPVIEPGELPQQQPGNE